jgi:serine/threonine-protein phosphatase 2A regulatory subunit A
MWMWEQIPLIRRLAVGDYNSTRIASAPLFSLVYKGVSEAARGELRQMFGQLCKDDVPLVRKGACAAIGSFAKEVEQQYRVSELLPLFTGLTRDEQVRLL